MILLFLLETRASNNSDWMYISSTITYFYGRRKCQLDKIYCKTKDELIRQDKKINNKTKYFNNAFQVILVADYDREEEKNIRIIEYCKNNNYELIWMVPNIERVFLDKDIKSSDKKGKLENLL